MISKDMNLTRFWVSIESLDPVLIAIVEHDTSVCVAHSLAVRDPNSARERPNGPHQLRGG